MDNPEKPATSVIQDTWRRQTKTKQNTTQHRKPKRYARRTPSKIGRDGPHQKPGWTNSLYYSLRIILCFLKNNDKNLKKITHTFNFSFSFIDDVLSLNISRFEDYLHCISPNELELKETTDNQKVVSYLDLHLEIDNGRLKPKLYCKRDVFTFLILKTSHSPVSIFQQHLYVEFTFRYLCVVIRFVTTTVIFYIEFRCWRKSYSNNATYILC